MCVPSNKMLLFAGIIEMATWEQVLYDVSSEIDVRESIKKEIASFGDPFVLMQLPNKSLKCILQEALTDNHYKIGSILASFNRVSG